MFEINNKNFIQYEINGTTVYEIQDFYKYPDKIVEYISNVLPGVHNADQYPSLNGHLFEDLRHHCPVRGMSEVSRFLSNICKQFNENGENIFNTNIFKFLDKNFNKYNDCYWWPHKDNGYTALIYLNNFSYPGTNLYTSFVGESQGLEHYTPWQPKSNYKLEKTLYAEYNKLVLFDGLSNSHSMAITDDSFYEDYRLNQVIFFKEEKNPQIKI